MMDRADLVALQQGRPVIIVEAKGRPVPPGFRGAVLEQLKAYGEATQSRWLMLADPRSVDIYRQGRLESPQATIDTREIIEAAALSGTTVGESVLLLALERWLRALGSKRSGFTQLHPELTEFARDAAEADDFVHEFHVH